MKGGGGGRYALRGAGAARGQLPSKGSSSVAEGTRQPVPSVQGGARWGREVLVGQGSVGGTLGLGEARWGKVRHWDFLGQVGTAAGENSATWWGIMK